MLGFDDCVEAHITGLRLPEKTRCIHISLRLVGGSSASLTIEGVERFLVNELREENIIDRINIWDQTRDSNSAQNLLAELISGSQHSPPEFAPIVEADLKAISNGQKILMEIEPVYGAWVVVLAKKFELAETSIVT